MKRIKKSTLKTIGIVLACILTIGAIVGVFALVDKKQNETTNAIHPTFSVGGLSANGKYENTKSSIYTKDGFECMGLDIDVAFDNNISYKVYFYDEDNEFISATGKLTEHFNMNSFVLPLNVRYARIVITPNEDENVSWWEVGKYSKQLTIHVNKVQKQLSLPYEGTNKMNYLQSYFVSSYNNGLSTITFTDTDSTNSYNATEVISTLGCSKVCIKVDESLLSSVQIIELSQSANLGAKYLDSEDFTKVTILGNTYLTYDLQNNCAGIFLLSAYSVDFSNFEVYVW